MSTNHGNDIGVDCSGVRQDLDIVKKSFQINGGVQTVVEDVNTLFGSQITGCTRPQADYQILENKSVTEPNAVMSDYTTAFEVIGGKMVAKTDDTWMTDKIYVLQI